jgi:hypothetical protein
MQSALLLEHRHSASVCVRRVLWVLSYATTWLLRAAQQGAMQVRQLHVVRQQSLQKNSNEAILCISVQL